MTSEQIYQFLPPNLRSFFLIESSLTSNASPVQQSIQAFAEAVRLLFSVASPTKVVTVSLQDVKSQSKYLQQNLLIN